MNTVFVRDHGILPDTDITLSLDRLLKKFPENTVFQFENAAYYFSPQEQMHFDYRLSNTVPASPESRPGMR